MSLLVVNVQEGLAHVDFNLFVFLFNLKTFITLTCYKLQFLNEQDFKNQDRVSPET